MSAYDDINATNATKARAAGWPELTGADKQIHWANTLRENKVHEFEAGIAAEAVMSDATKTLFGEAMLRETRAGEWIDGRNLPWNVWAFLHLTDDERAAFLNPK